MKKILAIVLSAMLLLSSVTLTVSAGQILAPDRMYAGVKTLTLKYGEDINAEKMGEISVVDSNGVNIPYQASYKGDIATLSFGERLIADNESYVVDVNGVKYGFTLKTVLKPIVADGEVIDINRVNGNSNKLHTISEDNAFVLRVDQGSIVPVLDKQYENISLVMDVKFLGDRPNLYLGFNANSPSLGYIDYVGDSGVQVNSNDKTTSFAWKSKNSSSQFLRMYRAADSVAGRFKHSYDAGEAPDYSYTKENINYENNVTYDDLSLTAQLTSAGENLPLVDVTVDKMGEIGTISFDGTLIDVWDTGKIYEGTSYEVPKSGYIYISPMSGRALYIKDLRFVTSEIKPYATGDITVLSTNLQGTRDNFEMEFSNDVSSAASKVKEFISITKEGQAVEYDFEINGNKIKFIPKPSLVYDKEYVVKVYAGFGYESLTVKENVEAKYMYISQIGDLVLTDTYAGYNDVYLTFDGDVSQIKQEDFKNYVKVLDNGEEITYTVKLNGNKATMNLDKLLERNKIYDLKILKGLGYENVTIKEDKINYFILDVIYDADFENFPSTESAGTLFTHSYYDTSNNGRIPKKTVRDGKLYVENKYYSTMHLNKLGIDELERYTFTFDAEVFGTHRDLSLYFNMNGKTGIHQGQGGSPMQGFGWHTTNSERQMREFLGEGVKSGPVTDSIIHANPLNPVNIDVASETNVIFTEAETDFDVTVPASNGKKYTYSLDKIGTTGTLYINNTLVDIYETDGVFEKWNSISSADKQITATTPDKGIIMIGLSTANTTETTTAFSNMYVTTYKEYTDGGVKVVKEDIHINGKNASGTVKVRNYFSDQTKDTAVLVAAYGENNKFLGVQKIVDTTLTPGEIAEASFNFNATDVVKDVIVELVDETIIPESTDVKVASMLQSDFDNNVVTVKGEIKPSESPRKIQMLLVKDSSVTNPWVETKDTEGNLTVIDIPADSSEFEYSFSYKDVAEDTTYTMSLYAITWNQGIKLKKLADYNYATNNAVLSFVESVKSNKTTFSEITKYAQSLGTDISFANSDLKKNTLVSEIYDNRLTISSKDDLVKIMNRAKARADILTELREKGSTVALVNNIIMQYKDSAEFDTTAYSRLSASQQTSVCVKFVNANYEDEGFGAFVKDFNSYVASSITTTPSGGGGGGGGGAVAPPASVKPSVEVTVEPDEFSAKDAVEIIGAKVGFVDMDDYLWAEEAVNALADEGIISGVGNKMFNPEGVVTREQIAKMIVSAMNLLDNNAVAEYMDVDASGWAVNFIASAKKSGLMNGVSETEFAPLSAVTRQDLAVILYRASIKKGVKYSVKKTDFVDKDNIADYAIEAVEYMAGAGIINGFEDGSFNPEAPATRAQAATLIYNALRRGK